MNLREWLFRNHITVTDLAKKIGVSRSHLNGVVLQWRSPSSKLAKKISEATNGEVTINELLFPEDFNQS
jgi:DNA-binding transcriptional regulator YdaS (Cro superfamily)